MIERKSDVAVFGVVGSIVRKPLTDTLWDLQSWRSEARPVQGFGKNAVMSVQIRYDDRCGNRHNTFSITAEVRRGTRIESAGCLHDEIAEAFPELAHLIKWHLVSSDGPIHYVANTVYLAGDRDHNGFRAGEVSSTAPAIRFDSVPVAHPVSKKFAEALQRALEDGDEMEVMEVPHTPAEVEPYSYQPRYTLSCYQAPWHHCPFRVVDEAVAFLEAIKNHNPQFVEVPVTYSRGKERNLELARSTAVWPEATDEQLCLPPAELEQLLLARLPGLMEAFRKDLAEAGLYWSPEEVAAVASGGDE